MACKRIKYTVKPWTVTTTDKWRSAYYVLYVSYMWRPLRCQVLAVQIYLRPGKELLPNASMIMNRVCSGTVFV